MNAKTIILAALTGTAALAATPAAAASADASAGARIVAPLQISKTSDLWFGTIAPSLNSSGVVQVNADGSHDCGPQLTCLTADQHPAQFGVTGEMDASYTISLPSTIQLTNPNGDQMDVYDFTGAKASGVLAGGSDSFSVGGKLAVVAMQAAGLYSGNFTVSVEYN